jgi:hypothetical protein
MGSPALSSQETDSNQYEDSQAPTQQHQSTAIYNRNYQTTQDHGSNQDIADEQRNTQYHRNEENKTATTSDKTTQKRQPILRQPENIGITTHAASIARDQQEEINKTDTIHDNVGTASQGQTTWKQHSQ